MRNACYVQPSEFAITAAAAAEVVVCTTTANFSAQPPVTVKAKVPKPQRPPAAVSGELFPCRICGKLVKILLW